MDLTEDMIKMDADCQTKDEAIQQAGEILLQSGCIEEDYIDFMLQREEMVSTYMVNFIAIPHGTDEGKKYIKKTGISIVIIPNGVDFGDGSEEKLVTVVFGIAGIGSEHLELLAKIAIFCSEIENVVELVAAQSKKEIIDLLKDVE